MPIPDAARLKQTSVAINVICIVEHVIGPNLMSYSYCDIQHILQCIRDTEEV